MKDIYRLMIILGVLVISITSVWNTMLLKEQLKLLRHSGQTIQKRQLKINQNENEFTREDKRSNLTPEERRKRVFEKRKGLEEKKQNPQTQTGN